MMVMDPVTPSIRNLMRMSREALSDNKALIEKLRGNVEQKQIRCSTVRWILSVMTMSSSSVETRDSAIQMLDKFIAVLDLPLNGLPLRPADKSIISLAAAAAVILASKIHEIRPLRTSNFPHFKKEQLIDFERRFLLKISFQIVPQITPSAFLRYLLNLWPISNTQNHENEIVYGDQYGGNLIPGSGSSSGYYNSHNCTVSPPIPYADILIIADSLMGLFWEDPECMHYAPSTIAISALLLTFSKLRLDCTEWLHRLPDECLPPKTLDFTPGQHPVFPVQDIAYLDIDNCLLCLQRIPMPMKYFNILNRGMSINVNMTNQKNNNNNNNNNSGTAMDCNNDNSSPTDSDTDGPSSVRTITPTSTADLNEERNTITGKNLAAE